MHIESHNNPLEEIVTAMHRLLSIGEVFSEKPEIDIEEQIRGAIDDKVEENEEEIYTKQLKVQEEIQNMMQYYTVQRKHECAGAKISYVPVNYKEEKNNEYSTSFTTQFWPQNVQIEKVPNYVLGQGVLGRAFTGLGVIQIDEKLHGDAFYEVLMHEMEHMQYPHLSEGEVRLRTRYKLPFKPIFH